MEWNGVAGAIVMGLSALALISLLFWVGHAVLNFLGDDIPVRRRSSSGNDVIAPVFPGPDPKPLQERGETPRDQGRTGEDKRNRWEA